LDKQPEPLAAADLAAAMASEDMKVLQAARQQSFLFGCALCVIFSTRPAETGAGIPPPERGEMVAASDARPNDSAAV
jgi:hypothetical protein